MELLLSGSPSKDVSDVKIDSRNSLEYLTLLEGRAARVGELEKENVLLRTELHAAIQESTQWSAKQGTGRVVSESTSTSTKGTNNRRAISGNAFDFLENLVQHNPELQDIIRSQKNEYRKLQEAHVFLLEKLRESHAVISCLKSTPSHANPSNGDDGRQSLSGTGSSRISPTATRKTCTDYDLATRSETTIYPCNKALPSRSDVRIHTVLHEEARREPLRMQGKLSRHSSTGELPWQSSLHKRRKGNPRSAFQDMEVIADSRHPIESGVHALQRHPHKSWIAGLDHGSGVIAGRSAARAHRCRSPYQSPSGGNKSAEIEAGPDSQDNCTRHCYRTLPDFHKSSKLKETGGLSKVPNGRQYQDWGELVKPVPAGTKSFRHVNSFSERANYDLNELEGSLSRIKEPTRRAKHQARLPPNAAANTATSLMADDLQSNNACGRLNARFYTERGGSQEAVKPDTEDTAHDLRPARKIHNNGPVQSGTSYSPRAVDLSKSPPTDYNGPNAVIPLYANTITQIQGVEPGSTTRRVGNTHDYRPELNQAVGQEAKSVSRKSAQTKNSRSRARNAMPDASGNHLQEMQLDMDERLLTDKERLLTERSCEKERHSLVDHVNCSEYTKQSPSSRGSCERLQLASTEGRIKGLRRERHANIRAPSPPGYWRTDMPSTQEKGTSGKAGI